MDTAALQHKTFGIRRYIVLSLAESGKIPVFSTYAVFAAHRASGQW